MQLLHQPVTFLHFCMGANRKSCFIDQAPSHSVLPVSSDSQSSLKDSPSREDIVDIEEPSPSKSPKITKKGKNQAITLGESGAGPASNKPSKAKSPKKRLRVEDQTPQQKKNTANKKRKTGILVFGITICIFLMLN
jgi:hypothetical protein